MRGFRYFLCAWMISAFCAMGHASFDVYAFDNDQQQVRFDHLIHDLRCPKCQNNNLADSTAPLATDIKNYVYRSIVQGKTDQQITDFLISRYGQFITYNPNNMWLWMVPLCIVICGASVVFLRIRGSQKQEDMPEVDMQELIKDYENGKE